MWPLDLLLLNVRYSNPYSNLHYHELLDSCILKITNTYKVPYQ